MLINTTFVTSRVNGEALAAWLTDVYVAAARESALFHDILALRILTQVADDAVSYAVQMRCDSVGDVRRWDTEAAPELYGLLSRRFGAEGVVHFTTHMREL